MGKFVNVHACLVHEQPDCVLDLVRNLRAYDPDSTVLLYNGGADPGLLASKELARLGPVLHPSPRPMAWGRLHDFALDCMRFALRELPFDAMTIVDSDQLALRPGYARFLAPHVEDRGSLGMLGNSPARQPPNTQVAPARTAFQEIELWRPFLRRFPQGEEKFVHWTFWPSTVFTERACRELTALFDGGGPLEELLRRSRIWATEEILLPTFTALLGLEIDRNPAGDGFVQFRRNFSLSDLENAFQTPDAFWLHPAPRKYADPLRNVVRARRPELPELELHELEPTESESSVAAPAPRLLMPRAVLKTMGGIEGWLEEVEGEMLLAAAIEVLRQAEAPRNLVEIGSYCGRSTSVLGAAVRSLHPESRVWAIDPHEGWVGADGGDLTRDRPTFERFERNLEQAGVAEFVETIRKPSYEVEWDKPVHLLLIDGLHDYANVARDFRHFERHVVVGGMILFHDYADYYPGVVRFVDELLAGEGYRKVELAHTLMAVQKAATRRERARAAVVAPRRSTPLVSCIMPTYNRRRLVAKSLEYFARQDYPELELIVVDDGEDSVEDLLPADERVRYERVVGRRSMGDKHNRACELARGEAIVHWDDDDWMAPHRVSYQAGQLFDGAPDALYGLDTLLFYEPDGDRGWRYRYPAAGRKWVGGGTFCYRKSFWRDRPHPDMNEGADTSYVWRLSADQVVGHADPRFYVCLIHGSNTSPKNVRDSAYERYPLDRLARVMGADLDFYRATAAGG